MELEIGFTDELTNTHYAPLAVLLAHYQQHNQLEPLRNAPVSMRTRDFSPADKLLQVMISILTGCKTLSEVNSRLRTEPHLAQVLGWQRFADQSSLSRTLDALSLKQIESLRERATQFWRSCSQSYRRNWHSFLWLDYDLSGLPCGPQAEASQKGYFGDKKMPVGAN